MHWGDAQSFFQISLALNLAYFTFRELRAPAKIKQALLQAQTIEDIEHARTMLRDKLKDPTLAGYQRQNYQAWLDQAERSLPAPAATTYTIRAEQNILAAEQPLRFFCLGTAILSMVLLIYSTVHYGHRLSAVWFWPIVVISLSPICVIIGWNLLVSRLIERHVANLESFREIWRKGWGQLEVMGSVPPPTETGNVGTSPPA
jgi:hypothetical protein